MTILENASLALETEKEVIRVSEKVPLSVLEKALLLCVLGRIILHRVLVKVLLPVFEKVPLLAVLEKVLLSVLENLENPLLLRVLESSRETALRDLENALPLVRGSARQDRGKALPELHELDLARAESPPTAGA